MDPPVLGCIQCENVASLGDWWTHLCYVVYSVKCCFFGGLVDPPVLGCFYGELFIVVFCF